MVLDIPQVVPGSGYLAVVVWWDPGVAQSGEVVPCNPVVRCPDLGILGILALTKWSVQEQVM